MKKFKVTWTSDSEEGTKTSNTFSSEIKAIAFMAKCIDPKMEVIEC